VAPQPSDIEGEQDHGLALAKDFMPLSAPISIVVCEESMVCKGVFPSL
jgi:hypothetical protein